MTRIEILLKAVKNRDKDERGFTLLELIIAIAIIGILVSIAIPVFAGQKENAQLASTRTDARNIGMGIEKNSGESGDYPSIVEASTTKVLEMSLSNGNNFTNYTVAPDGYSFSFLVLHGNMTYAVYDSSLGGICASGFGEPVECEGSTNPPGGGAGGDTSGDDETAPDIGPPEVTENPVISEIIEPVPMLTGTFCPMTDQIESIKMSDARTATLKFTWPASAGATKYNISLTHPSGNPVYTADQTVTGTTATFTLPRKEQDQYHNPIGGNEAEYYGVYVLRIVPSNAVTAGDQSYSAFQYRHQNMGCDDRFTEALHPGEIDPAAITEHLGERGADYQYVTFRWPEYTGATGYTFSMATKGTPGQGNYGEETSTFTNEITVKLPRVKSDSNGNPVNGNQNAPFYGEYLMRIQPFNATKYGDSAYRTYRYAHYDSGLYYGKP